MALVVTQEVSCSALRPILANHNYAMTGVTTQEKPILSEKENVKYKAFMTMNKIKEKLIHWLGGVTKEEHNKWLEYKYAHGKFHAIEFLLSEAKRLYGLTADQWSEQMYERITNTYLAYEFILSKIKKEL